jgi:ABC-type Fe3+ transport system permease subunit
LSGNETRRQWPTNKAKRTAEGVWKSALFFFLVVVLTVALRAFVQSFPELIEAVKAHLKVEPYSREDVASTLCMTVCASLLPENGD